MPLPDTFGSDFRVTNRDVLLATAIAVGLRRAARWLFVATGGALASLWTRTPARHWYTPTGGRRSILRFLPVARCPLPAAY